MHENTLVNTLVIKLKIKLMFLMTDFNPNAIRQEKHLWQIQEKIHKKRKPRATISYINEIIM